MSFQTDSTPELPGIFRDMKFVRMLGKHSLMGNKFLTVKPWQGEERVDIREWRQEFSCLIPTKKGVSLPLRRWKALCFFCADIEEALQKNTDLKQHIGGNVYAQVSRNFPLRVDLRHWFLPEGHSEVIPTKKGINMNYAEWKGVIANVKELESDIPLVAETIPCFLQEDHNAQLGVLRCPECSPDDHKNW